MSAAIQTLSDAPAPASSGAGDSALSVEQADALLRDMGQKARSAASMLTLAPAEQKTKALKAMAHDLRSHANDILSANIKDMEAGKARGLSGAMLDRLLLTPDRIEGIARGLEAVADQPDPIGAVLASWTQPNGLQFERVRVPLGVVGIIYESRPNVTMDAGALCLKSGNAAILRGGSESFHSSHALARSLAAGLEKAGLPADAIQLMPTTDRAAVGAMLRADHAIDIIIPRGGKGLIERVQTESRVPVIAHLDGICHTYLHASADPQMAADIVENAKMRRTGVCGATETVLVDSAAVSVLLPDIITRLKAKGCEIRGDDAVQALDSSVKAAAESDWDTEYLDAIVSIKTVDGASDAIAHINRHGSHHTESIVSSDLAAVEQFFNEVDAGIVLHNASTQFADGGEFGMGAEIGISTGKLHVRGPVGANELTSIKYRVRGGGHIRP